MKEKTKVRNLPCVRCKAVNMTFEIEGRKGKYNIERNTKCTECGCNINGFYPEREQAGWISPPELK